MDAWLNRSPGFARVDAPGTLSPVRPGFTCSLAVAAIASDCKLSVRLGPLGVEALPKGGVSLSEASRLTPTYYCFCHSFYPRCLARQQEAEKGQRGERHGEAARLLATRSQHVQHVQRQRHCGWYFLCHRESKWLADFRASCRQSALDWHLLECRTAS